MQQLDYMYKSQPYAHQHEVFLRSRDQEFFALLMEQGTGKSKPAIDTAAYLFGQGQIIGMLVIAPNGVHRNWVVNEIPAHLPDYIAHKAVFYQSRMKQAQKKAFDALFQQGPFLRILTMNVEAFSSSRGYETALEFLSCFPSLLVLDESSRIKTPGATRTKNIMKLRKQAKFRRILSGTMITNSPMDAFTQLNFLDDSILGYNSFYSFRNHFAETKKQMNHRTGREYTEITGYKNLDELQRMIRKHSFRVLKKDCLDLPEKVYSRQYVELSEQQRKLYNELRKELMVEFQGETLSVTLALTKLLRLQQIVGGFYTSDDGRIIKIDQEIPRMSALMEHIEDAPGKHIIWARFKPEIAEIVRLLKESYGEQAVVEYHGTVEQDDRQRAVESFQEDDRVKFFVGQARSGGIGLTLTVANYMEYYSNDYSLELRLQSEDRAHRIGQKNKVLYTDFEAIDTLDAKIIDALRCKKSVADLVNGDNPANWI